MLPHEGPQVALKRVGDSLVTISDRMKLHPHEGNLQLALFQRESPRTE
jgi:hypothetical protein